MGRKCRQCGQRTGPKRRLCKQCGIEKRHDGGRIRRRTPLETNDGDSVGSWILDGESWHASIEFDGYVHVMACGYRFDEFPADGCALDHHAVDPDSVCPRCRESIDPDTIPTRWSPIVMADGGVSLAHVRACELAHARGVVPEDGSGVEGVWTDEIPDIDTEEQWFIALNADDDKREYRFGEERTSTIEPFRVHFWYGTDGLGPASICTPHGGQVLVSGDEFERSTEDQIIASIEAVLIELGALENPVVYDVDSDDSELIADGGVVDRRELIIPTIDGIAIGRRSIPMIREGHTVLGPDPVAFEWLAKMGVEGGVSYD